MIEQPTPQALFASRRIMLLRASKQDTRAAQNSALTNLTSDEQDWVLERIKTQEEMYTSQAGERDDD